MKIVFIGLSITSSWGNGHATTYRGLLRELAARGHSVTFLERDVPWYAGENRDLPEPPYCRTCLYDDLTALKSRHGRLVSTADVVVVGSYVPQGVEVGDWVLKTARGLRCFYDIDTPVTLGQLKRGEAAYVSAQQVSRYDVYFSFAGGMALTMLEERYGSPAARALYCSFDRLAYYPETYFAEEKKAAWDLAYLGTYSDDRQPTLERLLMEPARRLKDKRFCVAGPKYPADIAWPGNVKRIEHVPPAEHRGFYNRQRFCLNVTRAEMIRLGHSPSVRLFEAAACGTPIISDFWEGLDELFEPGREILLAATPDDVRQYLCDLPEAERMTIAGRARQRVLQDHSAAARAEQFERQVTALAGLKAAGTEAAGEQAGRERLQPSRLPESVGQVAGRGAADVNRGSV
ncbi:MAG: glycosyltransferase [Phycisphaerae bacterium]